LYKREFGDLENNANTPPSKLKSLLRHIE